MSYCAEQERGRQEAYERGLKEFLNTAKSFTHNDIHYKVHKNVNLYLDVTGKCNGRCRFCIAKTNYCRNDIYYKEYIEKFLIAYNKLKKINPSIQIVGGEPSLWQGLPELLVTIKKANCRFPVLGTNGTGLIIKSLQKEVNNSSLEWINLSRHHYNDKENFGIMGRNVLKNKQLREAVKKINKNIRLQCNLIGGYIDTYGEVMQMIAYAYQKLDIQNIVFALLTPLPQNTIYQSNIIDYVKKHLVNCNDILKEISTDKRFRFIKYREGVACFYEVWEYWGYNKPVTVIFKFSDNVYLDKIDKMPKHIPDIIMHTNGTISGSWDRNIKKMF